MSLAMPPSMIPASSSDLPRKPKIATSQWPSRDDGLNPAAIPSSTRTVDITKTHTTALIQTAWSIRKLPSAA